MNVEKSIKCRNMSYVAAIAGVSPTEFRKG